MSDPIRVLVIDDSAVVRGMLSKLIGAEPDMEFAGSAGNGEVGIERADALRPDVIVLDIDMPVMGGLEALAILRQKHPDIPVIIFSTLSIAGASVTMEALSAGAADCATKPTGAGTSFAAADQVRSELLVKIRGLATAGRTRAASTASPAAAAPRPAPAPQPTRARRASTVVPEALIIGSSTGGPAALEEVLPALPAGLPVPIFIVQHMPPTFTGVLAQRLDKACPYPVEEASADTKVETGRCYLAPGGLHMRLTRDKQGVWIRLDEGPRIKSCRPAVDALFDSAGDVYGNRLVAAMLTGMGDDGLDSTRRLSAAHDLPVIVQDEETSVVWGMPGAVAKAGLATECLPLDEIAEAIVNAIGRSRTMTRKTEVATSA